MSGKGSVQFKRIGVSQTNQTVWKRSGELAFDGIKSRGAVAISGRRMTDRQRREGVR